MIVKVTNKALESIAYGFDPEHYNSVVEFYSTLLESGNIVRFTIE